MEVPSTSECDIALTMPISEEPVTGAGLKRLHIGQPQSVLKRRACDASDSSIHASHESATPQTGFKSVQSSKTGKDGDYVLDQGDEEASAAVDNSAPWRSSCGICHETYSRPYALRRHKTTTHLMDSRDRFECDRCGMSFSRKDTLRRHLSKHDRLYYFTCRLCNMIFRKDYLKAHSNKNWACREFYRTGRTAEDSSATSIDSELGRSRGGRAVLGDLYDAFCIDPFGIDLFGIDPFDTDRFDTDPFGIDLFGTDLFDTDPFEYDLFEYDPFESIRSSMVRSRFLTSRKRLLHNVLRL